MANMDLKDGEEIPAEIQQVIDKYGREFWEFTQVIAKVSQAMNPLMVMAAAGNQRVAPSVIALTNSIAWLYEQHCGHKGWEKEKIKACLEETGQAITLSQARAPRIVLPH